jgi:hypothetical protein
MRPTLLTRSVISVASLAIGSVALAATPATAVPAAAGTTRDQIVSAAAVLRLDAPTPEQYSAAAKALRIVAARSCNVDFESGESVSVYQASAFAAGDDADGVLVSADVYVPDGDSFSRRDCTISALVTTDASFSLSGSVSISASKSGPVADTTILTAPLSGSTYVSPIADVNNFDPNSISSTAVGSATKTTKTTTSTKVKDKKSAKEKKAAKKKFSKRLAQAKKNYAKALDKAGSSTSKKAAAKRVYAKARALAKAKYAYDTAGFKNVKKTRTTVENRPFSIVTGKINNFGS